MKILLDECVTKRLKKQLQEFDVFTVTELGWSGKKNGQLMMLCVENDFNIVLTIDKNLIFQQNLDKYPISIVVLNCNTSKIEDLITFVPSLKSQNDLFNYTKHTSLINNYFGIIQKHC